MFWLQLLSWLLYVKVTYWLLLYQVNDYKKVIILLLLNCLIHYDTIKSKLFIVYFKFMISSYYIYF